MLPSTTFIEVNSETQGIEYIVENITTREITVKSYNKKTKKHDDSIVISTRSSTCKDFIYIQTVCNKSIIMTHDHKVYVDGEWTRADQVSKGHNILTKSLDYSNIIDIHKISNNTSQKVYNLSVDDHQCFFANDILVHNDS